MKKSNVVTIKEKRINASYEFAVRLVCTDDASDLNFGDCTDQRVPDDAVSDHFRGKIGEFAFQQFLYCRSGIIINIDQRVYPGTHNTDDGNDLKYLTHKGTEYDYLGQYKVDVKAVKHFSRWLVLEKSKADCIKSDVYVVVKIRIPEGDDFEQNPSDYRKISRQAEVAGWIDRQALFDREGQPWFLYKKGDRLWQTEKTDQADELPRPEPDETAKEYQERLRGTRHPKIGKRLVAPANYGFPIDWMFKSREEWDDLVKRVTDNWIPGVIPELHNTEPCPNIQRNMACDICHTISR